MKLYELKRMLDGLHPDRLSEEFCMYHPFYQRLFKVEAIDDLKTIRPDLPDSVVLITSDEAYG